MSLAYTEDSDWRNRSVFLKGRAEIVDFLARKWEREREYRLIKEVFAWGGHRIAVRFAYEYHDAAGGTGFVRMATRTGSSRRTGLMRRRIASINDVAIAESARLFHWDRTAPRPEGHAGLSELGL